MTKTEAITLITAIRPEACAAQGLISSRWKIFGSEDKKRDGVSLGSLGGGFATEAKAWQDASEQALVDIIKDHARKHYEGNGGWDTVIECMDDADILEVTARATTARGAINLMATFLGPRAEQQRMHDLEAEAGR